MSKEEKIQESYGIFYNPHIDENGWFDMAYFTDVNIGDAQWNEWDKKQTTIRPKSLQGIENNNGWIKIESESDLPEYGYYEVIERKSGNQSRATLDNDFGIKMNLKHYSHYQKIKEIPNPIY